MAIDFVDGNRLTLLNSGGEFFPALIECIEAATTDVQLETYIFEDDASGRPVMAALKRAAGRGVKVRVLVDGSGAARFTDTLQPELLAAGAQVMVYRRELTRFSLRRQRLRRLHRKLASIDNRIAFVGGINIIDDMNQPGGRAPRYDYAVRIEGPLVASVQKVMERLWTIVVWASFRRRFRIPARGDVTPSPVGDEAAALVIRDNIRHRRDIEDAYLEAIISATDEIVIANAYFLPGFRFRRTLLQAARRGVRVSVLLQGKVEYRLQHYATQALYGALLKAGVRIFEYQPSFLHAKVAVIDGNWATVGSSNIDPFSLMLAKEANIVVRNRAFAMNLRQSLKQAITNEATELLPRDWRKFSWYSKLLRWTCYQLVRLAIGIAGYGGKH
ncbi:MAG: cardiolipin synthase ClsB [Betaproteobacteria bacterium]|uniref:Cardiolipin synthase B n=1 Tax=Candidatus Proximibacter danicus TaxID=2954365 RepID=A0A9D7K046_9PROT|nr:cardiolipin synthase ClsB [Candidatus Proximibacter danicus]